MGTVVTIQVVGHDGDSGQRREREDGVARAIGWFEHINDECTRFDATSELRQLSATVGVPVPLSAMLFEALQFAFAVAEESGGAFDPTVGHRVDENSATFRDVHFGADTRTVTLLRPLVLDLGAVAKGLAIDMAARELAPFGNFAIDAGGDLYFGGHNADDKPWTVGIRHPRDEHALLETLQVSDVAVCTSGDYERRGPYDAGHHIINPHTGASATELASVTVLAPSAMVADALATAAFVLGPARGLDLLERHGVSALLVTPALDRFRTSGMQQ
jgi:thiamine biosynthesis lipoprotein